jgi:RHS repeat-associated protein
VKVLTYDSFGRVLTDSAPSFSLPIGYAGGLADPDTGLVRFGYRDYDPAAGRWTARDPSLYGGGQENLYAYVGDDPIRLRDPLGLFCVGGSAYEGVGGGASICFDESGWGFCGEVGFGVGEEVHVNPFGHPEDFVGLEAEVAAGFGKALGIGAGGTLNAATGCLEGEIGASVAYHQVELVPHPQYKGPKFAATEHGLKEKFEAKLAGKGCTIGEW